MKNTSLLLLMVLLSIHAFCQNEVSGKTHSSKISDPYSAVDAVVKEYFYKDGQVLALKIQNSRTTFQKFNSETLELMSTSESNDLPRGAIIENVFEFNKRFYVFFSRWERKLDSHQLFCREIDFENGNYKEDARLVLESKGKIDDITIKYKSYYYSKSLVKNFFFKISEDESRILISYDGLDHYIESDEKYSNIGVCVIDREFNIINHEVHRMPYSEQNMEIEDYFVSPEGRVFMLIKLKITQELEKSDQDEEDKFEEETTEKRQEDKFSIELIEIQGTEIKRTAVDFGKRYIHQMRLYQISEGLLNIVGLYYEEESERLIKGIVSLKIDLTLKKLTEDLLPFSKSFLLENLVFKPERLEERNPKYDNSNPICFYRLMLSELIKHEDGTVSFICEQRYEDFQGGIGGLEIKFFNLDIVICNLDVSGNVTNLSRIPREIVSTHYNTVSQFDYQYSNGVERVSYFEPEFESEEQKKSTFGAMSADVWWKSCSVEGDGKVNSIKLLKLKGDDELKINQYHVERIVVGEPDELFLETYKGAKEDLLIKIELWE